MGENDSAVAPRPRTRRCRVTGHRGDEPAGCGQSLWLSAVTPRSGKGAASPPLPPLRTARAPFDARSASLHERPSRGRPLPSGVSSTSWPGAWRALGAAVLQHPGFRPGPRPRGRSRPDETPGAGARSAGLKQHAPRRAADKTLGRRFTAHGAERQARPGAPEGPGEQPLSVLRPARSPGKRAGPRPAAAVRGLLPTALGGRAGLLGRDARPQAGRILPVRPARRSRPHGPRPLGPCRGPGTFPLHPRLAAPLPGRRRRPGVGHARSSAKFARSAGGFRTELQRPPAHTSAEGDVAEETPAATWWWSPRRAPVASKASRVCRTRRRPRPWASAAGPPTASGRWPGPGYSANCRNS
jgi:hypothetical protein